MECIKCGLDIKNNGALTRHEKSCNGITAKHIQAMYDNGSSLKELIDLYGHGVRSKIKLITKEQAICNLRKINAMRKGISLSKKTKEKISKKLKESHLSGKHPGWSHINLDPNRRSFPEKFFKELLKNEGLFNKYNIIEQFQVDKYFLDFAIIDIKLDIEIDGNQHYTSKYNIDYDNNRNKFLEKEGWKVYRINWQSFYNNTKNELIELITYISNIDANNSRYYSVEEAKVNSKSKIAFDELVKRKKEKLEKIKLQKEALLHSNINFEKFGWVKPVSEILMISPQKVNKWMKTHLLKFYDTKCYKRKAPLSPRSSKPLKA